MSDLIKKQCRPCEGGVPPLSREAIDELLAQVPSWSLTEEGRAIERTFTFDNYYETLAFVNATAWVSHRQDHHPDLEVGYSTCVVRYTTHAIGGLSENDFICAAHIDALVTPPEPCPI